MKSLISYLLLCCTFLLQTSTAMQNTENPQCNNINMQALHATQQAQIIESELDNENLCVSVNNNKIKKRISKKFYKKKKEENEINLDDFLSELSNDKKFLMIRDINNKILNEEEHTICSKFKITPYILLKYKRYWNELKFYIDSIKKEAKSSNELVINTVMMSGNLLLSISNITNEIENNSTIIKDDVKYYLNHKRKRSITEIIKSENSLKGNNIFNEFYVLSQIISGVMLKWQTSYVDVFAGNNNSKNGLINCMKQLDKIFEIFCITDK